MGMSKKHGLWSRIVRTRIKIYQHIDALESGRIPTHAGREIFKQSLRDLAKKLHSLQNEYRENYEHAPNT